MRGGVEEKKGERNLETERFTFCVVFVVIVVVVENRTEAIQFGQESVEGRHMSCTCWYKVRR